MRGIGLRISAAAWCLLVSATVAGEEQVTPQTLVKVDDFAITNLHLALFASQTGRAPDDAEGQIALLNELVNSVMVANSAQGRELAAHPEVAAALEVARIRLIAQTFVRSQMRQTKIDEARLRELYESEYLAGGGQEFKARHILLDSENAALEVIADLDKGADFATLATERSIGPSKSVGGDLAGSNQQPWFPSFRPRLQNWLTAPTARHRSRRNSAGMSFCAKRAAHCRRPTSTAFARNWNAGSSRSRLRRRSMRSATMRGSRSRTSKRPIETDAGPCECGPRVAMIRPLHSSVFLATLPMRPRGTTVDGDFSSL